MDPMLCSKQSSNPSNPEKDDLANVKAKREAETNQPLKEEPSAPKKVTNSSISSQEGKVDHVSAVHTNVNDKRTDTAPVSPKRRKVIKTRIDERGREGKITDIIFFTFCDKGKCYCLGFR